MNSTLPNLVPRLSAIVAATILVCTQAVATETASVCLHVAAVTNQGSLAESTSRAERPPDDSYEPDLCVDLDGDGHPDCVGEEDYDDKLYVSPGVIGKYATLDPSERWQREEIVTAKNRSSLEHDGKHYVLNSIGEVPSYLSTLDSDGVFRIRCEFEQRDGLVRPLSPYEMLLRSAGSTDRVWATALMRPGTDSTELLLANGHTIPATIDTLPSLTWAIAQKRANAVEWLLLHGASVNATRPADMPLVRAVWVDDVTLAARLLRRGADPLPLLELNQFDVLARLPPEGTRPLIVAAVKRRGHIPEFIVRHAIGRDPPLLDDLVRSRLKVQLASRDWHAGKLMLVPFEVQADAYHSGSRAMNRKLERLYNGRSLSPPRGSALLTYGSFERGLVIWRWEGSSVTDEEIRKFATSVCLYFTEADCGPRRLQRDARAWAEQLHHECPNELRGVLTPPACKILKQYRSLKYGLLICAIDTQTLSSRFGARSRQLTVEDLKSMYSEVERE